MSIYDNRAKAKYFVDAIQNQNQKTLIRYI